MVVKASVQRLEASRVALEVEVPAEEVQKSLDEAYRRLARRVQVPGFRPGRVPPAVLRARLGRQPIYDEALELLLPRAYRTAIDEQGLEPVEEPKFDIVRMEDGQPLVFRAEVTVKPEVRPQGYRGVRVRRNVYEVTDADVDRVLRRLQERLAVLEPTDEPARRGHFVELDYDALLDGKPFRGGAARGRTVELGREQVAPGFDAAVEGLRAGEERSFDLTVPQEGTDPELAGRRLSFTVRVQAVKAKRLPPIDDDMARDLGAYQSLEQLRQAIRDQLQQAGDRKAEQEVRREVVDRLVQALSVEVPEPMVRRRTDTLLQDLAQQLAQRGLTVERYLELTGRSASELVASMEPVARRQLLEELALDAVAKAEGITVDPAEVDRQVRALWGDADAAPAGQRQRSEAARRQALQEELWRGVEVSLRRQETVRWLVEQAKVESQPVQGLADEELEVEVAARIEAAGQQVGQAV